MQHPLTADGLRDLALAARDQGVAAIPLLEQRVTQFSSIHRLPASGLVLTDNYAPVDIAPGRRQHP